MVQQNNVTADICILVEGSYPYVAGGVSSWIQSLLTTQQQFSFHLVALVANRNNLVLKYEIPDNVLSLQHVYLQDMPKGTRISRQFSPLFNDLKTPLLAIQQQGHLSHIQQLLTLLQPYQNHLGTRILLNSKPSWNLLLSLYRELLPESSFINYFWSWRSLMGGLFAALLGPLPKARVYHTISTGYAGILAARAKIETGNPVILTEHGIYTNERRIEILMADWLQEFDQPAYTMDKIKRDLRQIWMRTFESYARACYDASDQIITLYGGNQTLQRRDGANAKKLRIIPNGIDYASYTNIIKTREYSPNIALIGRVVPIKDVKTYIRSCDLLRQTLPNLTAYILGPYDEDPDYYEECQSLVAHLNCQSTVQFMGQINVIEYLSRIDVMVLTSLSEAQPLVILEAGAAGIPCVATDVGACHEMIIGPEKEDPALGPGGAIVPLASPKATANAIKSLLTDQNWYTRCSTALQERIRLYYDKAQVDHTYQQLYANAISNHRLSVPQRKA